MNTTKTVRLAAALLIGLWQPVWAGTLQRAIPTTSAFTSQLLTNETSSQFRSAIGISGSPNDGGTITNLNASQLRTGKVPDAVLSTNVPLLSNTNTYNGRFVGTLVGGINGITPSAGLFSTNLWWWASSVGINCNDSGTGIPGGEGIVIMTSGDGTNWTRLTSGLTYSDPDSYTNNCKGPIAREFALQYDNGKWLGLSNFDPYNDGTNAQGSGLYYSYDLTNWNRQAVLYLQGQTNAIAHMFAGSWFTDVNGDNYYLYSYQVGSLTSPKKLYITKRLDSTYTNWGQSVMILNTNAGRQKWDGSIIYANHQYQLYTVCNDGNGIQKFTNNTLTTEFTVDNSFRQGGNLEYDAESPMVFRISTNILRMYFSPGHATRLAQSVDDGVTWDLIETLLNGGALTNFFSPGMVYLGTPPTADVLHLSTSFKKSSADGDFNVSGGLSANTYIGKFKYITNGPPLNYHPPILASVTSFTNGNYRVTAYGSVLFNLSTATSDNGVRVAKMFPDGSWVDVCIVGLPAVDPSAIADSGKATLSFSLNLDPNQPYRIYRESSQDAVILARWQVEIW